MTDRRIKKSVNSLMSRRLALRPADPGREMHLTLANLARGELIDTMGAVVLKELLHPSVGSPISTDLTGFEAHVNNIHVSDFLDSDLRGDELLAQAITYAETLVARLNETDRPFRVLLSRDPESDEVTVRFFLRRKGQPWSVDDPEEYQINEVIQWDLDGPAK
jgi:hypothetical protein